MMSTHCSHISLISNSNSKLKIFVYDILKTNHPDNINHTGTVIIISNKLPYSPFIPKSTNNLQIISTSVFHLHVHCNCLPNHQVTLSLMQNCHHTYKYEIDDGFNYKYALWSN